MRKTLMIFSALAVVALIIGITSHQAVAKKDGCVRIQDGELYTSDGNLIVPGYDEWGYNYQAHMFNGYYCDAYRDAAWCQPYKDIGLMMRWNDAWLSKVDRDGDSLLDRHYGYPSY